MILVVVLKLGRCGLNIIRILANKQDLNGAIDELDLVENLDVEQAANAMKCPTRVETCSCISNKEQCQNDTIGIKNGYKWLLDTIVKNYAVLNNRTKQLQSCPREYAQESQSVASDTPSRISVQSNPFKPIRDLLALKEESVISEARNGINEGKSVIRAFVQRNKTAPLPVQQPTVICENISQNTSNIETVAGEKSTQTMTPILTPVKLNTNYDESFMSAKLVRPYTAPERSQRTSNKMTIINIPGQVPH